MRSASSETVNARAPSRSRPGRAPTRARRTTCTASSATSSAGASGTIGRSALAEIPGDIIRADGGYGGSSDFRNAIRLLGFDFGVGIQSNVRVVRLDRLDRARGEAATVLDMAMALGRKAFRKITWRHGSKAKLSSRFCFVRVKTMHDDGIAV